MEPKARVSWPDTARGLGIVLVVYGHVARGLTSAGIIPADGPWAVSDFALYTFHMPAFFFLAGLNVQHSLRRGKADFLRSKAQTVVYPYVLWSLIQGGVLILLASVVNTPPDKPLLLALATGTTWQFWFLYALAIWHLVAVATLPRRSALLGVALLALCLSAFLKPVSNPALMAYNGIFYALGVTLAPWIYKRMESAAMASSAGGAALTMAAAWGLCAYAAWAMQPKNPSSLWAIPAAACGSAALLLFARSMQESAALRVLGRNAMTIYALHIFGTAGARIAIKLVGAPATPALHIAVGLVVGIGAPLVAHELLRRLGWLHYFGLAPWPRPHPTTAPPMSV